MTKCLPLGLHACEGLSEPHPHQGQLRPLCWAAVSGLSWLGWQGALARGGKSEEWTPARGRRSLFWPPWHHGQLLLKASLHLWGLDILCPLPIRLGFYPPFFKGLVPVLGECCPDLLLLFFLHLGVPPGGLLPFPLPYLQPVTFSLSSNPNPKMISSPSPVSVSHPYLLSYLTT